MKLAVFLLAGGGTRLKRYTQSRPKCLVEVAGQPLLLRMLDYLSRAGIERCILVVGYRAEMIRETVGDIYHDMKIVYIENSIWATTNNVVSLEMAIDAIDDDFILLEGDLIFTWEAFKKVLSPDSMAVDQFQAFMDGTVVNVNNQNIIERFFLKSTPDRPADCTGLYKTVNIYNFRLSTFKTAIIPRLRALTAKGDHQVYYEQAIAEAVDKGAAIMTAANFAGTPWYEIDTEEDLEKAEALFADN